MKNEVFYGVGNLSFSIVGNTISNFFIFFGTSVLGIGGTLIGLAVAITTAWNGLSDPIMGLISDKHKLGKFGYRKGYMLAGAIGMALINLAIWCVPLKMPIVIKFLWTTLSLFLVQTFLAVYTTPYYALGVDLSSGKNNMTRLIISKTLFMFVGMILPSVLITVFLPNSIEYPIGQLNPVGYRSMAFVVSGICIASALFCIFFTKNVDIKATFNEKITVKSIFGRLKKVFANKQLRALILAAAFANVSGVVLMSVGMHFFTYCFYYTSKQITIMLVSLLLGASLSQILWYYMSKKDKQKTVLTSIFVTAIGVFCVMLIYVFRFQLNFVSFYLAVLSMFVCGVGSGAMYTMPLSMYNDRVKQLNIDTKENNTATYTGVFTFVGSAITALSQLVCGVLLDLIKFDSKLLDQTLGVQMGLALILFGGVMIVLVLSYLFFAKIKNTKIN